MTPREIEEYRALRATIRERGTQRVWLAVVGLAVWAVLALVTLAVAAPPLLYLVTLLPLAVAFEAGFAVHTAVERVGRYLQVFYESDGGAAGWERTAMEYGRAFSGGGVDPLFSAYFWLATLANLVPAMLSEPVSAEWAVIAAAHGGVAWRIFAARRRAAVQRSVDLERFTRLRDEAGSKAPKGVSPSPAQS